MQDTPDQRVEQGVTLWLAVTNDVLDEGADSARQEQRGCVITYIPEAAVRQQVFLRPGNKGDPFGCDLPCGEAAHGPAKTRELGTLAQLDADQHVQPPIQKRLSCRSGSTNRRRRSIRSVSPPGRWSGVTTKGSSRFTPVLSRAKSPSRNVV
jgi:hypothetical protein